MIPAAVKLFECDAIRNRCARVSFSPVARFGVPERVFGDDLAAMGDSDVMQPGRCDARN